MTSDSMTEHLYVHVPFCEGKCDYCAFYSVASNETQRKTYAPLPGREPRALLGEGLFPWGIAPRTLYIGGGTPGVLGPEGLRMLVEGLREVVTLDCVREWTVELNPCALAPSLAELLIGLGVNRISIGAQCFDDEVLRSIGRRHTAADAERAVGVVRSAGFTNVGLDLIAGLPGLTPERWRRSVERAIATGVVHLSVYALSVEPDTPLARREADGRRVPGAEVHLAALDQAEALLTTPGILRYGISNYARPGWECRHNLACWRGADYVGLGPAAATRLGLRRWTNRPDLAAYVAGVTGGAPPPRDAEILDPVTDATERLVFGLRLAEGVNLEAFAGCHPAAAARLGEWQAVLARLSAQGLVGRTAEGSWRLTRRGREVADTVIRELV